jgi:hypothetical protein
MKTLSTIDRPRRHVRPVKALPVLLLPVLTLALLGACSDNGSTSDAAPDGAQAPTCDAPGGPAPIAGGADMHCGTDVQPVSLASCMFIPDGGDDGGASDDGGAATGGGDDAGPLPCGENGPSYGSTMYGTEGDDDDCKYHVSYSVGPVCENESVYFVVVATYKTDGAPLTGANPLAEICLNDTHIGPPKIDSVPPQGLQTARESPPGTYTIGPIQFDEAGKWTVRFHFYETCYDTLDDSPHGHAAFFMDVP